MVMEFFRSPRHGGLEQIERQIATMLGDCRHSFDSAMHALVSGADAASLAADVRETDRRINDMEQTIRRELVVHASVRGGQDVPVVLAYMIIVRMLERVGDQNKNVLDLAAEGVSFVGAPDHDQVVAFRDELSALFATTAEVFTARDDVAARKVLGRCDELVHGFESLVVAQLHSEEPARHAVPRALLYRYLKRITANLANVMSSVVMPLDQIDYYGPEIEEPS
jgi:phosphate uptake regulator